MNNKYAITGAFSTGKTTLLEEFEKQYRGSMITVKNLERELIKEIGLPKTQAETEYFQRRIIALQVEREFLYKTSNTIHDNCLFTSLAYTKVLCSPEVYEILAHRVDEFLLHYPYTDVFYLPIEFAIEKDGVRHEDDVFQKQINEALKQVLLDFGQWYIILKGTIIQRMDNLLRWIT